MGEHTGSPERSVHFPWQRVLLGILAIAFVWLVVSHIAEVEKLASTLKQGQWQWVVIAAALQVVYYLTFAATYQAAFYALGIQRKVWELVPVTLRRAQPLPPCCN